METYLMFAMGAGSMVLSYIYLKQRRFIRLIMIQYEEAVTRLMQHEFSKKVKQRKQMLEDITKDLEDRGRE